MILPLAGIGEYVTDCAKSLYTQGFDLVAHPVVEIDAAGLLAFSIVGRITDGATLGSASEINLDEIWVPIGDKRWERHEYAYDLIDRGRSRRRAFHCHDRDLARATLRSAVHEHCEEVLGEPTCGHYVGRDIPDAYAAIRLLMEAWVEPGQLGCESLNCL